MTKTLALALLLAACASKAAPPAPAAEPWNGGKQTPAFAISSTQAQIVAADSDVVIPLAITPGRDCRDLSVTVRGIDGIVVAPSHARLAMTTCARGVQQSPSITVHVPANTAGYVAVDVHGMLDGAPTSTTYSIALRTANAQFKHDTLGEVTTDSTGKPIVRMIATPQ